MQLNQSGKYLPDEWQSGKSEKHSLKSPIFLPDEWKPYAPTHPVLNPPRYQEKYPKTPRPELNEPETCIRPQLRTSPAIWVSENPFGKYNDKTKSHVRKFWNEDQAKQHMQNLVTKKDPIVIDLSATSKENVIKGYGKYKWEYQGDVLSTENLTVMQFVRKAEKITEVPKVMEVVKAAKLTQDKISKTESELIPFLDEITKRAPLHSAKNIYINCEAGRSRSLVTAINFACYFESEQLGFLLKDEEIQKIAHDAIHARNRDIDGAMSEDKSFIMQNDNGLIKHHLGLCHKGSEQDPAFISLFTEPFKDAPQRKALLDTIRDNRTLMHNLHDTQLLFRSIKKEDGGAVNALQRRREDDRSNRNCNCTII